MIFPFLVDVSALCRTVLSKKKFRGNILKHICYLDINFTYFSHATFSRNRLTKERFSNTIITIENGEQPGYISRLRFLKQRKILLIIWFFNGKRRSCGFPKKLDSSIYCRLKKISHKMLCFFLVKNKLLCYNI